MGVSPVVVGSHHVGGPWRSPSSIDHLSRLRPRKGNELQINRTLIAIYSFGLCSCGVSYALKFVVKRPFEDYKPPEEEEGEDEHRKKKLQICSCIDLRSKRRNISIKNISRSHVDSQELHVLLESQLQRRV